MSIWLYVWLRKATISPCTMQAYMYVLYCLVCAVGQTQFPKTSDKQSSWGVTSVQPVVIDVKKEALSPVLLQSSHCLSIALPAMQPAQYLLRHLRSNLGWQPQMAPLIQVNYLWTFQSKQASHSPELWSPSCMKRVVDVGVCTCMHAWESHKKEKRHTHWLWLCQYMTVYVPQLLMWKC